MVSFSSSEIKISYYDFGIDDIVAGHVQGEGYRGNSRVE